MGNLLFLIMYLVLMLLVVFVPQLLRRFHVPAVVAIMLTGIVIGPHAGDLLGCISHVMDGAYSAQELMTVIRALGLLGLVFLMALAGMEVDLRMLTLEKRPVIWLSLLTFAIPSLAGYFIYAWFRPDDTIGKWVYASLFASHSVGIVFPVIRELGVTKTRFGISVLASTVVTDVLSLVMLAVAIQYKRMQAPAANNAFGGVSLFERIDVASLGVWFTPLFLLVIALFILLAAWIIPAVWRKLINSFSPHDDTQVTFFLLSVLVIVTLGELLGVNLIVGAFIAGLAVVRSEGFEDKGRHLHRKLEGIGFGVMIPFLFLQIGMESQPGILVKDWGNVMIALATVVGLVGSKTFAGWLAMRLSGFSHIKGICAGLMTVPQLSATLAAAAVALELEILDQNFFNAIVLLSMVTTIPVPTMVRYLIDHYQITFDPVAVPDAAAIAAPQLVDSPAAPRPSLFSRWLNRKKRG
ncbi:MAG: cation:proton antiporter [Kiritimatiellae bacterium]|nr:cation:proton antiporter [Kiritimatiellia bacterium]